MNKPVKLALLLLAVAIVLAVIGLVLKAVRWILYVAVIPLLAAGAVHWLAGRSRSR